jgi:hypothetical protein
MAPPGKNVNLLYFFPYFAPSRFRVNFLLQQKCIAMITIFIENKPQQIRKAGRNGRMTPGSPAPECGFARPHDV